jgi:hypothetical protein
MHAAQGTNGEWRMVTPSLTKQPILNVSPLNPIKNQQELLLFSE